MIELNAYLQCLYAIRPKLKKEQIRAMGIFSSRSGISQLHCILMFTSKPEVFFLIINLRLNFVVTKAGNLQIKSVFWFRFLVLSCFSAYVRREVVALFQMTCINEYRLMMIICFLHSFQP